MIEITAEALGEEYAKDADGAKKKYGGKLVRVSGKIDSIYDEMMYLSTGKKLPAGQPVKVSMRFPSASDTKEFSQIERITVEGRVGDSGIFGPSLVEFRVIEKTAKQAVAEGNVIKAADLTKAYKDDKAAADKKYKGKLTIEGVVKDISMNKEGELSVTLAGHDASSEIVCNTFKDNEAAKKKVKKEQTVKIRGLWYGEVFGTLVLGFAELVE